MISKELFCKAMNAIQAEKEENNKLEKALENYLLEGYAVIRDSQTFDVLLELLKELFHDNVQYSTIEWWLFEKVEKKIYNEDKTVFKDVTRVEDLYDYLVSNIA